MQALDQSWSITEPAFRLFRFFVRCLIFLAAVAASRWGIRTFLLNRGGKSHRWRNSFSAATLVVLVFLHYVHRQKQYRAGNCHVINAHQGVA